MDLKAIIQNDHRTTIFIREQMIVYFKKNLSVKDREQSDDKNCYITMNKNAVGESHRKSTVHLHKYSKHKLSKRSNHKK